MKVIDGMVRLENILDRLEWAALFPRCQPVVLDLGAGDGGFAAAYAEAHPERNVLAVERLLGRARKVAKKSIRKSLVNLCVIRIESAYLVDRLLPAEALTEMHILFPDPWPKKKHLDRRIVQPHFLEAARRALSPRGRLRFVTDHAEYFEAGAAAIDQTSGFERMADPEDYPPTDFEKQYVEEGRPINGQVWQRV